MTVFLAGQWNLKVGSLVVCCVLLQGMAGCGAPSSDKPAKSELREETGKVEARAENARPITGKTGQEGAQSTAPTGSADAAQQESETASSLSANVPPAIAMDLASPDARTRYRALDYWDNKENQVSLDPVFEAMEDDDPAVRAKATAIVEQYYSREQEGERE